MDYELNNIDSVECLGTTDDYVYDIEMADDTEHTFFANDILVHNSLYITIQPILKKINLPFLINNKINPKVIDLVDDLEHVLNTKVTEWAKREVNSLDPKFVFKREAICDVGIFIQKKRYILHILNDEGIDEDKIKYVGVEVVSTSIAKKIKPLIKNIVETMIKTKNEKITNNVYMESYEKFKQLSVEEVAFPRGLHNFEKYKNMSNKFTMGLHTPIHVKSSLYYNELLDRFNLAGKYEKVHDGIKVKFFYTEPNAFSIESMGFIDKYPNEFGIKVDYKKMFEKTITAAVERLFSVVGWRMKDPNAETAVDLFDLLA